MSRTLIHHDPHEISHVHRTVSSLPLSLLKYMYIYIYTIYASFSGRRQIGAEFLRVFRQSRERGRTSIEEDSEVSFDRVSTVLYGHPSRLPFRSDHHLVKTLRLRLFFFFPFNAAVGRFYQPVSLFLAEPWDQFLSASYIQAAVRPTGARIGHE